MTEKTKTAPRKLVIQLSETELEMIAADIVDLEVDAVVNAAHEDLTRGSGVSEAILEMGGPSILKECKRIGKTPVGTAVMTGAGELKAKQVIHAVGPTKGEGDEDRKLSSAVRSALALAQWPALDRSAGDLNRRLRVPSGSLRSHHSDRGAPLFAGRIEARTGSARSLQRRDF